MAIRKVTGRLGVCSVAIRNVTVRGLYCGYKEDN